MNRPRSQRYIFLLLLAGVFSILPGSVSAAEEKIDIFSSHIELNANGSASVQEEIVYDFGDEERHGIIREIPLVYTKKGDKYETRLQLSSISVTDGHGTERDVSYDDASGNVAALKIGDPDVTLRGTQLYVIHYTLWGAVDTRSLLSDQFYFNVTGDRWQVPIERIRADIVLLPALNAYQFKYACLTGEENDQPCNSATTTKVGGKQVLRFEHAALPPKSAINLSVEFPKGAFMFTQKNADRIKTLSQTPFAFVKWWQKPMFDLSLIIPLLVFVALLSIWWSRKLKADRKAYILGGIALVIISLFIPEYNLAVLLSGLEIVVFGGVVARF